MADAQVDPAICSLKATVQLLETQLREKSLTHSKEVEEIRTILALTQTLSEQNSQKAYELTNVVERLRREKEDVEEALRVAVARERSKSERYEETLQGLRDRPNAPLLLPASTPNQVKFLCEVVIDLRRKYAKAQANADFFQDQLSSLLGDIEEKSESMATQQRHFTDVSKSYVQLKQRLIDLMATDSTQESVISELQRGLKAERERGDEARSDCQMLAGQVQSLLCEVERLSNQSAPLNDISIRNITDIQKENIELKRRLRDVQYLARADMTLEAKTELEAKKREVEELKMKITALEKALSAPEFIENSHTRRGSRELGQTKNCFECCEREGEVTELREEVTRLSLVESGLHYEVNQLRAGKEVLEREVESLRESVQREKERREGIYRERGELVQQVVNLQGANQRIQSENEVLLSMRASLNQQLESTEGECLRLITTENEANQRLYRELKETQEVYKRLKQDSSEALMRLTAEKENLLFDIKSLRKSVESEEYISEIAVLRGEVAHLKSVNLALESSKAQLTLTVSSQLSEISTSESLRNQSIFRKLKEQLEMTLSDSEAKTIENRSLTNELKTAIAELEEAKGRIGELEMTISDFRLRYESTQSHYESELSRQSSLFDSQKTTIISQLTDLQQRNTHLERENQTVKESLEALQRELTQERTLKSEANAVSCKSLSRLTSLLYRTHTQLSS